MHCMRRNNVTVYPDSFVVTSVRPQEVSIYGSCVYGTISLTTCFEISRLIV